MKKKAVIISLILITIIGVFSTYFSFNNTNKENISLHQNSTSEITQLKKEKKKNTDSKGYKEPLNILLIGLDGYKDGKEVKTSDNARADTIILLSVNPNTNEAKLINIPRDTRIHMDKVNKYDKINHSYVFGGVEYTTELVQELFKIPIDYYAVVNMYGLVSLVDSIGGVKVKSPLTFTYEEQLFEKDKEIVVNGEQALKFSRMRYDDPEGDFGRQKRQKILLKSLAEKLKTMSALEYAKIVPFIKDYVKTNLPLIKSFEIYSNYKNALTNIELVNIEDAYEGVLINEIYYGIINHEKRLEIINMLRKQSDLSQMKLTTLSNLYNNDVESRTLIDHSELTEDYLKNEEIITTRELNNFNDSYITETPVIIDNSIEQPVYENNTNIILEESNTNKNEIVHSTEESLNINNVDESKDDNATLESNNEITDDSANNLDEEVLFTPVEENQ